MADKNLYANDLIHRQPTWTFTETVIGGKTKVEFKDGATIKHAAFLPDIVDAYRAVRDDYLNGEEVKFLSTTVQKNALTGIPDGVLLVDTTLGRLDACIGGVFISAAGAGMMLPAAHGNLSEDSATGSPMNSTTKLWETAIAGVMDGNGLVTHLNHADGDRLVMGNSGGGNYIVIASCGHTNSGNNKTTMTVQVNGTDSTVVKDDQNSNSTNHRPLVANGILAFADNDYIALHIVDPDTPANVIKVFDCHLTIQRIS